TLDQAKIALTALADNFELPQVYTIHPRDLVERSRVEADATRRLLDRWSLSFAQVTVVPDWLILDNPVWQQPFIRLDDDLYFCACIQSVSSFMLARLEGLLDNKCLATSYAEVRSEFLESEVERIFGERFGSEHVYRAVKWRDSEVGKDYEA